MELHLVPGFRIGDRRMLALVDEGTMANTTGIDRIGQQIVEARPFERNTAAIQVMPINGDRIRVRNCIRLIKIGPNITICA